MTALVQKTTHCLSMDTPSKKPFGFPKPVSRKTEKRKKRAAQGKLVSWVREQVFERDDYQCRACHKRAEEMHEIVFRSLGGVVSLSNSIALCRECHANIQQHRVDVVGRDANEGLKFVPHVSKWSKR